MPRYSEDMLNCYHNRGRYKKYKECQQNIANIGNARHRIFTQRCHDNKDCTRHQEWSDLAISDIQETDYES